MDPNRNQPNKPEQNGKRPRWLLFVITAAVILTGSMLFNTISSSRYEETTWNDFKTAMDAGKLEEVQLQYDRVIYTTKGSDDRDSFFPQKSGTGLPNGDI